MSKIDIGDFTINVGSYSDALERHLEWLGQPTRRVTYALHVGGLNLRSNERYVEAFNSSCDFAYPDGMSIVMLARLSGSKGERVPTTDLGHDLLRNGRRVLGRKVRVAAIGGSSELAKDVRVAIEERYDAVVCFSQNGFDPFTPVLASSLRAARPDVVFVGMGMPTEAFFCEEHRDELPECLIMTCGGWFGFICGNERRAPRWAQRAGLEWVFRLAQHPTRLARRYGAGMRTTAVVGGELLLRRLGRAVST